MKTEKVVGIDYSAQSKPYRWSVFAIKEDGSKSTIEENQGPWVEAMFAAQDWSKVILAQRFLELASDKPWLSSMVLKIGPSSLFENNNLK